MYTPGDMDWLNYNHLYYLWMVGREGSIARACEKLLLAQPTVSEQIRELERSLGEKLFEKRGRALALTETGQVVFRYAEDIFALGRELVDTVKNRPSGRPIRCTVGVADVLFKLVVYRLLKPVMDMPESVYLVCREGPSDALFADLARHNVDLVLSDTPISPHVNVKAFNHLLGECGISVLAKGPISASFRRRFPRCLEGAPFVMPDSRTTLRRSLEAWFNEQGIRPRVRAEFADSALLSVFGQIGAGFFAAPTVIEEDLRRQHRVQVVGRIEAVRERFYAISVERKIRNPAVAVMAEAAKKSLF